MSVSADASKRIGRGRWPIVLVLLAVPVMLAVIAAVIIVPQLSVRAVNDAAARDIETWLSGLLLAAVISALRRAHVGPDRKVHFLRLAWLVPLVGVVLVVLLWPVLLGPGGEYFAP